jgi:hypothetical protein
MNPKNDDVETEGALALAEGAEPKARDVPKSAAVDPRQRPYHRTMHDAKPVLFQADYRPGDSAVLPRVVLMMRATPVEDLGFVRATLEAKAARLSEWEARFQAAAAKCDRENGDVDKQVAKIDKRLAEVGQRLAAAKARAASAGAVVNPLDADDIDECLANSRASHEARVEVEAIEGMIASLQGERDKVRDAAARAKTQALKAVSAQVQREVWDLRDRTVYTADRIVREPLTVVCGDYLAYEDVGNRHLLEKWAAKYSAQ